ncbi:MAG: hypothetical protein D3906_11105, partial [Candidatus Electrothrix sp. AUS1_2]|nr:hypothetical protein [Candidatus Electrothrix sp. AUS1_2]
MHLTKTFTSSFRSLLTKRYGGVLLFLLVCLGISSITRFALLVKAAGDVAWNASLLAAAGWGLLFDLATGA